MQQICQSLISFEVLNIMTLVPVRVRQSVFCVAANWQTDCMAELQYGIILHSFSFLSISTKHPLDTLDKVNEGHVEEVDQIINKLLSKEFTRDYMNATLKKKSWGLATHFL